MVYKRKKLIARFQQWIDTDPRPSIVAAQCANIAEQYAKDELELFAIEINKEYNLSFLQDEIDKFLLKRNP